MAENENKAVAEGTNDPVEVEEAPEETFTHATDLDERIKALESGQEMMSLLANPGVQDVLRAEQAGKKVKVVVEEPEPEPRIADEVTQLTEGLDEDDPNRDLMDGLSKLLDTKLGAINERLVAVEGAAKSSARKEVSEQVAATRKKFTDFDEYKGDILELSKQIEGLGVDELYLIAKSRKGNLKIDEPSTFTEKPTSQPGAHRRIGVTKPKEPRRGRSGFQDMVAEALADLDLDAAE